MNKRQLAKLIHDQRPEPSPEFEARIDSQLARLIEEGHVMKRTHKVSVILIAAVLTILLAGTAFALGYTNLMEYLQNRTIKPLDGTEELIQTEFDDDTGETELVTFNIEEAIFDGRTAIIQLHVSPADPENTALLNMLYQATPESVYNLETTQHPDGTSSPNVTERIDGKRIISYGIDLNSIDSDADIQFEITSLHGTELDNGSVRIWLEGDVTPGNADAVELTISLGCDYADSMNAVYPYRYEKQIRLENNATASRAARLVPADTANGDRFEIIGAYLTYNQVQGHIAIDYAYLPDEQTEPMGIDFKAYDVNGNEIAIGAGTDILLEMREDGTEVRRTVDEIQAYTEFPETIYLEVKVIGEDRTLGRLKFTTEEADISEIDAYTHENAEQLTLNPVGSWEGEHFCLLEGSISAGRKINIAFTYDGDSLYLAQNLTVNYKDPTGNIIGEAITSTCTIKENSYVLEETLDGSGWPSSIIIEFEVSGTVLDSFECTLVE